MALELIKSLFFNSYQFLASIKVPGFDLSFIQLLFGLFGAYVSICFLRLFFGLGDSQLRSSSQSGGNNKNIKISKERRGDTR